MSDKIKLLPEIVANQIAAGEVVNSPSSVVKEMMENSIDAGAHCIKVNYRDGGKELIQIVDDGCGMSPVDARMAFDRHATSKISTVDDIYKLRTFGFRGEALASIAAVAQVELRTRQPEDETGTETIVNGGEFISQKPVMAPVGSQFMVRNLFYNVPARRKFVGDSTRLASQIKSEFQRVALCNPDVAFELYANDAPIYRLPRTTLAGRIIDVIGKHIKQNLLEVETETSIVDIKGYIGQPSVAKKRNNEQFLFVNGRFFKSQYLNKAILKAYEKLIPEGSFPSFFIFMKVNPERVDVNVHPQKTEVKFADEEAVWQIVHAAMRETLAKTGAVPMMDFDRDNTVEIPVMQRGAVYSEPLAMSNRDYNPFREEYIDPTAPDPNVDFTGFDVPYSDDAQHVSDAATAVPRRGGAGASPRPFPCGIRPDGGFDLPASVTPAAADEEFEEIASGSDPDPSAEASGAGAFAFGRDGADGVDGGMVDAEFGESTLDFIPSEADAEQQRLDVEPHAEFSEPLPLGGGYVAALLGGRFVVVDVRRARERVLYEEYLRVLGHGEAVSEQLLFPERLELSGEEYALMEEHAVEFAALGFDIDLCGDGVVEVKGTPADLPADSVDTTLYELLQAFATPVSLGDVRRERIAAAMARSAVRGPQRMLSREEAAALLARLAAGGNISFSPSGKAILTEITTEELRGRLG